MDINDADKQQGELAKQIADKIAVPGVERAVDAPKTMTPSRTPEIDKILERTRDVGRGRGR